MENFDRKNYSDVSLFNPDYILETAIQEFVSEYSSKNFYDTILDYGCGNAPYENLFKCDNYIKADVVQNKSNSVNILLDANNVEFLDIANDSVDIILCMDVLEHSGNADFILSEFYRILKPKGVVLISLPFMYREHEMPNDLFRYTSTCIRNLAINSSFQIVDIKKIGSFHYVIFSLWFESIIKHGEIIKASFMKRLTRKVIKLFLPIFNKFIFKKYLNKDESIYHHLLISLQK